ncbi:MAG: EF-hand domain-containing protein [Sinimarinibacterium flocculans]|jgi:hypothetical protein|uniref:EF hand domain-containing protein n=2 Tax=Sinimarinibacterium flocculans TaxID=985250 RepID=A0A318E0S7_9GAMM|nr:EF-hand domain-containing protein [Pseudomonadota bacterium]PXV63988.1 EF hand domain-containing protein [Sinimarinibacterium flocculans]
MLFRKTLPFAAAAAVLSLSAFAQNYPGMADQMAPGGEWVGTPNYGASSTAAASKKKTCFADFDTDGDGGLSTSELDPNSQLYKRFSTRDANGDGKLTRDEYAFIC